MSHVAVLTIYSTKGPLVIALPGEG